MSHERQEYLAQLQEKLDVLSARIAELEAKANERSGDARRELKAKISTLRESGREAERRLEEVRLASKEALKDVKLGAEHAWKSLADAVESAGRRF
jgi:BMFP domain-containing protein YqiC